jgi:hypothetical protein
VEDTTEEESTPDASTHQLNIHPEYRIYRAGLSRSSLKQVLSSVSGKLASLRLSSETLDELEREQRARRLVQALSRTFRHKKQSAGELPVYKQGSSGLGARIAHGTETSDYADPRTLFPNITPSKKAASLLGVRPYSVLSLVSNLTSSSSSGYAGSNSSRRKNEEQHESDGSADSFYERSFEAIESTLEAEAPPTRDSAVFSDPEDSPYHLSLPRKIPPPVPEKPSSLRLKMAAESPSSESTPTAERLEDECDSSSVASTVIEAGITRGGWVKHVICKIQGSTQH